MTETHEVWMGYLVSSTTSYTVVQSPFMHDEVRVFGADSDATTMVVAAILHRLRSETIDSISVPNGVDAAIVAITCGVHVASENHTEPCLWDVLTGDEAMVVLSRRDATVEIPRLDVTVDVDSEHQSAIETAWELEMAPGHVSQGAFVSQAMYLEGAHARLAMKGQQGPEGLVWPPRFGDQADEPVQIVPVSPVGSVLSWTQLSAAGAPSEFSLRAPLLGGLKTVLLALNDGPRGVFLLVDDEDHDVNIGDRVELVLRRLYAQEGFMRYGLKGRLV